MTLLFDTLRILELIVGFGFVVFFHELGHFLAAKWVGIRCEQFAVGFGQALLAYRKKVGWRVGSTNKEVRQICADHLSANKVAMDGKSETNETEPAYSESQINKAMDDLGYGETEYRLNWIPLGGYVKMLGQDDTNAAATSTAPNSYGSKSIPARMLVVSAGVIMNVILAALFFTYIFYVGHEVTSPTIGTVLANSPAQRSGLQVGDQVVRIDGDDQPDFMNVQLSVMLLKKDQESTVEVLRWDDKLGKRVPITLHVRPEKMSNVRGLLGIGIGECPTLKAPPLSPDAKKDADNGSDIEKSVLKPGEVIVEINGNPVKEDRYDLLYQALQASGGNPVELTIQSTDGKKRSEKITPILDQAIWGGDEARLEVAGMEPRVAIRSVDKESDASGKILPGDVIVGLKAKDLVQNPDDHNVRDMFITTGDNKEKISVTVEREGQLKQIEGLVSKIVTKVAGVRHHVMGLGLVADMRPITSNVIADSVAGRAKVPSGFRITAVDSKPVENWLAVKALLETAGSHVLTGSTEIGKPTTSYTLDVQPKDVESLKHTQATTSLFLESMKTIRITKKPLQAAKWGAIETRNFVLQFYVTISRIREGSVTWKAASGPIGIVAGGAAIAQRGTTHLIWFLAMISANLAVVNFLPIPIVDGGLFTFLILEKIKGKPLSPKFLNAAQMVGLALILSVFVLVTFQDIRNLIGI